MATGAVRLRWMAVWFSSRCGVGFIAKNNYRVSFWKEDSQTVPTSCPACGEQCAARKVPMKAIAREKHTLTATSRPPSLELKHAVCQTNPQNSGTYIIEPRREARRRR